MGELEFRDGLAELVPIDHVLGGFFDGCLGEPAGPAAGLKPSGGEPRHLELKALALRCVPADQVFRGNKIVLELEAERVHPSVSGGGIRFARHFPAARLDTLESVPGERVLGDDEEREPLGALAGIGVGAGEQRQDVGAPGKSAPRLGAVDDPARHAVDGCSLGSALGTGDVAADTGLGDRNADHDFARGELGEPLIFLLVGTASEQRFRENFRTGDQGAGGSQGGPGEFLGGEDHRQIAHFDAPVLLGNRKPEETEFRHFGDERLGD